MLGGEKLKAGKCRKIIKLITVTTSLVTFISAVFNFIPRSYLKYKYEINADRIKDGADGPTSVYISAKPNSNFIPFICAILSLLGIIYLTSSRVNTSKTK